VAWIIRTTPKRTTRLLLGFEPPLHARDPEQAVRHDFTLAQIDLLETAGRAGVPYDQFDLRRVAPVYWQPPGRRDSGLHATTMFAPSVAIRGLLDGTGPTFVKDQTRASS
jgi:hypothetical protein